MLSLIAIATLLPALISGKPVEKRALKQVITSYRNGYCLSLPPNTPPANNVLLTTLPCDRASVWDISPGSGSVILSGTNFALDAGVPQGNNNVAKIYQSYPGSPQQTWYYTTDNRIAVTGGNQCLDQGANGPQTYQCTPGNTNQIWFARDPPVPPPTTTPSGPTTTTTTSSTTTTSTTTTTTVPPPVQTGKLLKWQGSNLCATVQGNGVASNGALINAQTCSSTQGSQQFNFMGNGLIMYGNTNFCIDAGSNPANGIQLKLWQCYPGAPQQTWNFPGGYGLFRTANNQCIDLDNSNFSKIQTWTCSQPDAQQQFSII